MSGRRQLAFSTLGTPGEDLAAAVALASGRGVRGIEVRSAPDGQVSTAMSGHERATARAALARAGVALVAVDTYVALAAASPEVDLRAELELAADLGAPAIRVFMKDDTAEPAPDPSAGRRSALSEGEHRAVAALREAGPDARRLGVRVLVETHDQHASAPRLARFMAALDAEVPAHGVGVVWDTAHPWSHGEPLAASFAHLAPWIGYIQVKDERSAADPTPCALGAGTFPADELVRVLDAAGWDGWVSLEWERQWHPDLADLGSALDVLDDWAPGLVDARGLAEQHTTGAAR